MPPQQPPPITGQADFFDFLGGSDSANGGNNMSSQPKPDTAKDALSFFNDLDFGPPTGMNTNTVS